MENENKISFLHFNKIKQDMTYLCEQFSDEDNFLILKDALLRYAELQKQLLSYDLSEIPFDLWRDVYFVTPNALKKYDLIMDDSIIDFSRTHANLDFSLCYIIDDDCDTFESYNFKGCNLKHVEQMDIALNEDYFDLQVINQYPDLFLSDSFSEDFKEKYAKQIIGIEDLIILNSGQISELQLKMDNGNQFFRILGLVYYQFIFL